MNSADKLWELAKLEHKRTLAGRPALDINPRHYLSTQAYHDALLNVNDRVTEINAQISKLLEDE